MPQGKLRPPRIAIPATLLAGAIAAAGCADPSLTGPELEREAPPGGPVYSEAAIQQFTGDIRIGVVPSAEELTVGGTGPFTILDLATGDVILSGNAQEATVAFETPPVVETHMWAQITCTGSEAIRDDLVERAEDLGYETFTEFVPAANCWRVRVGKWPADQTFGEWLVVRQQLIDQGLATDPFRILMTFAEPAQVLITLGGQTLQTGLPIRIEPDHGHVLIAGAAYRGVAEVVLNSSGLLAGVNELPLEEYLYGVVPRELPPAIWDQAEAQKAQAVTARTFALANLGRRAADGYDLLPTTADQVYGGVASEHPVSSAAVDATRGEVAVYEGNLINTLYHSTSGGWTANSEDVFITALPYLRGVPDQQRGAAFGAVPSLEVFQRHANPINLRAKPASEFESDWSQFHRWRVDWTAQEMAAVLAASLNQPITEVTEVRVVDRADQGRVLRIEFDTDAGTFGEEKDRIRGVLRYIDGAGVHQPLRSTLFFIEAVFDSGKGSGAQPSGWVAYGGGWGHGVGMSQTGAAGMAERGRTHEEILKHYYQGIELETREF